MHIIPYTRLRDLDYHVLEFLCNAYEGATERTVRPIDIQIEMSDREFQVNKHWRLCTAYSLKLENGEFLGRLFTYNTRCAPKIAIGLKHLEVDNHRSCVNFSKFNKGFLEVAVLQLADTSPIIKDLQSASYATNDASLLKDIDRLRLETLQKEHLRMNDWDYEEID